MFLTSLSFPIEASLHCTIENVWWDDVCEDALSIKGGSASSVAQVIGGGYYAQYFGKLQTQRKVTLTNVYAVNPKATLVGVNKNYNDQAKFSNIKSGKTPKVCTYFQGGTSSLAVAFCLPLANTRLATFKSRLKPTTEFSVLTQ
ncbi:unnamed protein product [Aphanomyces euteiches]